jgi:hypothetical protein
MCPCRHILKFTGKSSTRTLVRRLLYRKSEDVMKTKLLIPTLAFICSFFYTFAETADQTITMGKEPNRSISSVDQEVIQGYNKVAHALDSKTRLEHSRKWSHLKTTSEGAAEVRSPRIFEGPHVDTTSE